MRRQRAGTMKIAERGEHIESYRGEDGRRRATTWGEDRGEDRVRIEERRGDDGAGTMTR